MKPEEKFELIKRNTEEILGEEELKELIKNGEKLKHYIGFEISKEYCNLSEQRIKNMNKQTRLF